MSILYNLPSVGQWCCCCVGLRRGTIVYAILSLVVYAMFAGLYIDHATKIREAKDDYGTKVEGKYSSAMTMVVLFIIYYIVETIAAAVLLRGTLQKNLSWLNFYLHLSLGLWFIYILLSIISQIVRSDISSFSDWAMVIIAAAFHFYALCCINTHYQDLVDESSPAPRSGPDFQHVPPENERTTIPTDNQTFEVPLNPPYHQSPGHNSSPPYPTSHPPYQPSAPPSSNYPDERIDDQPPSYDQITDKRNVGWDYK